MEEGHFGGTRASPADVRQEAVGRRPEERKAPLQARLVVNCLEEIEGECWQ